MQRHFFLRRNLARLVLRLTRVEDGRHVPPTAILVGAPHTSNWDWVLTLLLAWDNSMQIRLLVKDSFFKGPLGIFMRCDRRRRAGPRQPGRDDQEAAGRAETDRPFLLGIAAEGTRSKGEYWKSGFYRIAQQTGHPDHPGLPRRALPDGRLGPDVHADRRRRRRHGPIRAFFADKRGFKPELATVPRLREEGTAPEAACRGVRETRTPTGQDLNLRALPVRPRRRHRTG